MKQVFVQNKIFFLLFIPVFLLALATIFITEKIELHSYFNQFVGTYDAFFKYITYLGDGIFIISFILVLLFFSTQKSLTVLIAYAISSIFTQICKYSYSAITSNNRPVWVFEQGKLHLNKVADVNLYINESFPSGHATAAFSFFFCLSFFAKKTYSKIIYFIIAILTAFSRVYLSQHFFEDITAGSFIGFTFSWMVCAHLYHKFHKLNKPIWK